MSKDNTIAFVHGPYFPNNARIDTMPFVLNSLRQLADEGWIVDVFLWESPGDNYSKLFPDNVSFHYQTSPVREPADAEIFRQGSGYRCVCGVGQMGSYVAAVTAQRNDCPLVLFNNEFPSQWGTTPMLQAEVAASQQADLLVVPDTCRADPLLQELRLPPDTPCLAIPNGPPSELSNTDFNWHNALGVSEDKTLCLNAGSISDFAQVAELMTTVPLWPTEAVLVLNERNHQRLSATRKTFEHLHCENRIIWNSTPLSEESLHSLVFASSLNFALYRNTGPNIEYAGFSSGKLMRSIAAGVPVIASDLLSFRFIKEHRLGRLIRHPLEIPDAIEDVLEKREEYSLNCKTFYRTHCLFKPHWELFCDHLLKYSGIDLRSPLPQW